MQNHNRTFQDCPDCGVSVITSNETQYDILAGQYLTGLIWGIDTRLQQSRVYILHVCDPAAVEAQDLLRARVLEQLEALAASPALPNVDAADYEDAKQEASRRLAAQNAAIREHGLLLPCPKCNVPVGQRCENMVARKRGEIAPTTQPHTERLPFPVAREDPELRPLIDETQKAYNLLNEVAAALEGANALEQLTALIKRRPRAAQPR